MNTTQHLDLIKAYCLRNLEIAANEEIRTNYCAGAAEAGWKATIAAIDSATALCHVDLSPCNGGSCMVATTADEEIEGICHKIIHEILAAYPLTLIRP